MKKKLLALILASFMILAVFPISIFTVAAEGEGGAEDQKITPTEGWYQENATTLEINNKENLMAFSAQLAGGTTFEGKTIVLTADIQLNDGWTAGTVAEDGTITAPPAPTNTWPVITKAFNGTFDGQGHSISGIYLKGAQVGIFGTGGKDACIKNLAIINSYVEGTNGTTGGIFSKCNAANSDIKLENLYLNINIKTVGNHIGGLIGYTGMIGSITINNTVFAGNMDCGLSSDNKGANIGGFIGAAYGHATTATGETIYTIKSSAFYGKLKNEDNYASAFIGRLANGAANVVDNYFVGNCIAAGDLNSSKEGSNSAAFFAINNISENLYTVSIENSLYTSIKIGPTAGLTDQATGKYTKATSLKKKDYHLVTDDKLTGLKAQTLLDEYNLTGWVATFGYAVPRSIDSIIPRGESYGPSPSENPGTGFVGYQLSDIQNGSVNIRLVGVLNTEDYTNYTAVGYEVVAYYVNAESKAVKSTEWTTQTVYESLTGYDGKEIITYSAEDYDGKYLFALNCNHVQAILGEVMFRIATFHETADGTRSYDAEYQFEVSFPATQVSA